jgi:hypothetical protein
LRVEAINLPGKFESPLAALGWSGMPARRCWGELADRLEHVGWG